MDSLDLTLRLGMSFNEDEQPQLPPIFNANGASNMTQVLISISSLASKLKTKYIYVIYE